MAQCQTCVRYLRHEARVANQFRVIFNKSQQIAKKGKTRMTTAVHQAPRRPQMADGPLCNDPLMQWSNHLKTGKRDVHYDGFLVGQSREGFDAGQELDAFL